ncbi:hypothetical protein BaRGS_00017122 [Batillaria attramentaria]|uniref:Uncharacterized protein n=1 Tax=Batillaria attramentaria TaxID=370345 RepID=A0ABD0KWR3_9CAEN
MLHSHHDQRKAETGLSRPPCVSDRCHRVATAGVSNQRALVLSCSLLHGATGRTNGTPNSTDYRLGGLVGLNENWCACKNEVKPNH